MQRVKRFDAGELKSPTYTPEGYLKVEAYITRTGVFKYMTPDGKVRRELRHPEDVFDPAHLESFKNIPVTNEHPWEDVSVENWKQYAVGHTGAKVEQADQFVKSDMTITERASIDDVMERRKDQVSCGYNCTLEMIPGTWEGQPYDARQRNMRGNHVALVPYGRAGDEVKIKIDQVRMDAADAILEDFIEKPKKDVTDLKTSVKSTSADSAGQKSCDEKSALLNFRKDQEPKKPEVRMAEITIDSIKYDNVPETIAQVVKAKVDALSAAEKKSADLSKEVESLKGKTDAQEGVIKAKEAEIAQLKIDAVDEKKAVAMAKARLKVEDTAKAFLGDSADIESMSVSDMKKAVVEKISGNKMDGKSEEHIAGMFDVYASNMDSAGTAALRRSVADTVQTGKDRNDNRPRRQDHWKNYTGPGAAPVQKS